MNNSELKDFHNRQEPVFLVSGLRGQSPEEAHRLVKAPKPATRLPAPDLAALELEQKKLESIFQRHFVSVGGIENQTKMLTEAQNARAVYEASKPSPLEKAFLEQERADAQFYKNHASNFGSVKEPIGEPLTEYEIQNRVKTNDSFQCTQTENHMGAGRYAIIENRWWSDEFRIRTQADKLSSMPTPENTGDRVTKTLSLRGARTISDSCEFMAAQHGGYTTFLTLTFSDDARARVAAGEVTIQKEVKRFFDGLNQVFKRGFQYVNDKGIKVEVEPFHGAPKNWKDDNDQHMPLPYCWVVEIPKNENGDDNPHLHVLLGWRVAFRHFDAWSKRVESLWGQGFAHLEKIKEAEHAGAYLAKAAGYLSKAQGAEDQGEVHGNRYWISKPSRADGWECIGKHQAGEMGGLIRDVYRFMQFKYGYVFQKRAVFSNKLAAIRKAEKNGNVIPTGRKKAIGNALTKCRSFIKELPARATKYSLIIKGEHNLGTFLNWSARPYDKNVAPMRLHNDGELKAFWLPVTFGKRRGWQCEDAPETAYYKNLKQERAYHKRVRNRPNNLFDMNIGGIKSILKSETKQSAYAEALASS
ncbi:hypothetical protein [Reinekea sp.]|jgi:hypothetical protein|uniref:rolling circle replication-associated protein n=1 Tax=Reinekea sp. TaxID=1970455 RepID=UPI003988D244